MKYYSTKGQTQPVSLKDAVLHSMAEDGGLFMPMNIKKLPDSFFKRIKEMSLQEMSEVVADAYFGEDVESSALKQIVDESLNFDIPLVKVTDNIYCLELFHGPTLAFKDVGARFMSRLTRYFIKKEGLKDVNILVATSGDTGSAVANGFLGVEGIHVYVLYPKGKVSPIQECQFTTLGKNVTALEIDGTFDDCQKLVKTAFLDSDLRKKMYLASANSINIARFLPQSFYYFYGVSRLFAYGITNKDIIVSVPSGNFGNLTAGLFAKRLGLPVHQFIAANNANRVFYDYLQTALYNPQPTIQTIANAMDVGNPSNYVRLDALYDHSISAIRNDIMGCTYTDEEIKETMRKCKRENGYTLDPHGAVGFRALDEKLKDGQVGIFLETAHPAKFKETVESIIGKEVRIPERLAEFMKGTKDTIELPNDFNRFKNYLMNV